MKNIRVSIRLLMISLPLLLLLARGSQDSTMASPPRMGSNQRVPAHLRQYCLPRLYELKGSWVTSTRRVSTEQFTAFSAVLYTATRGDAVDTFGAVRDARLQVLSAEQERVMRVAMMMPVSTVITKQLALDYYLDWRFACQFKLSNVTVQGTYVKDDNALLIHCEIPREEIPALKLDRHIEFVFRDLTHNGQVTVHACAEDEWQGRPDDPDPYGVPMPPKTYHYTVCLKVRNEACNIEEWLDFNRLKGVDHAYVYDDQSSDDLKRRLAPYVESGWVTLLDWGYEEYKTKAQAIQMNDCMYRARDFTVWQEHTDVDEFMFSANPNVSVKEFLRAHESLEESTASLFVEQYLYGDGGGIDIRKKHEEGCGRYLQTQDHVLRGKGNTDERMKPIHRVDLCNVVWVHKTNHYVGWRRRMDPRKELRCNHYWAKGKRGTNPQLREVEDDALWRQFGKALREAADDRSKRAP